MKNEFCLIRANNAGVFFGRVARRDHDEVDLEDVRRIWYWEGACSLSQLAVDGTKKPSGCKFTVTVPKMTVLGVCEIIPCSEKAIESIGSVPEWKI